MNRTTKMRSILSLGFFLPGLIATASACVIVQGTDDGTETVSSADSSGGTEDTGGSTATSMPSDGTTTSASASASASASESTSGSDDGASTSADETAGSDEGPACDPATFTEVRGCAEVIGEGFCSEGAEHVTDGTEIPWEHDPPHSGPHYGSWETWGEHDSTVPRGNWVHNLEHGGIVLSYLCPDGCDAELDVLRSAIAERPDLRILLTPDPLLPGERFAAISWTWVYRTDAPDLETLLCFVDQHENHAPEDVP